MEPSLAQLQHDFAAALRSNAPTKTPPNTLDYYIVEASFSAKQRLQIYRNNVIMSLSELLTITYPMVQALVGDNCFQQLARHHVLNAHYPHGDVRYYGEGFAKQIVHFKEVMQQAPYLQDVAQLEWCIDQCRQSTDQYRPATQIQPLTELAQLTPAQQSEIQLHIQPSLQRIESPFRVLSLYHAMQNNELDDFDINKPEQGCCFISSDQLHVTPLSDGHYLLLTQITQGQSIDQIDPDLLMYLNDLVQWKIIIGFSHPAY